MYTIVYTIIFKIGLLNKDIVYYSMNYTNKTEVYKYALMLSKSNKIDLAIEIFKKIHTHYPNDFNALYNIARLSMEKKDFESAIKYYSYLLVVDKENIQAKFDLSYIYLIKRDLQKGFKVYENRIKFKEYNQILTNKYPKHIKKIKNKRIFIYWEQGFGDSINFIRYVKYLLKYTKKIDMLIQKPLISLFQYNFNYINFIEDNTYLKIKYDYIFPLLSIPYLINLEYLKPMKKYLTVDRKHIQTNKKSKLLKIGLCWQGEFKNKRDKQRSIDIEVLLQKIYSSNIKDIEEISFYSLQKDIRVQSDNIIDLGKSFLNFYDTSVAITSMDLIITVDTSVCHLSAALGKKTFLLLPFHPDWRWGNSLKKSDLYKSIGYFRQSEDNSWTKAFDKIIRKLMKLKRV